MGAGFPAVWVVENDPGSLVFDLSGCHTALGARAMLHDLDHLVDQPVTMALGELVFEKHS